MRLVMLRFFDVSLSLVGLLLGWPIFIIIYILGKFDTGEPLFFQTRVGKDSQPFVLIKFRTMTLDTQSVATHMVQASSVTRLGQFLRSSKLDELPQLINVLKGDMSFVGPRPCLFNQEQLINERTKRGVMNVLPGITGLAQVNGIDMSDPEKLARVDEEMLKTLTVKTYFSYIFQTAVGKGSGDKVQK